MDEKDFASFFRDATGFEQPYRWQIDVAKRGLPEILSVPTGLGKTEGVALAWAWRRTQADCDEPLHLIYCLPMRSLVRQTVDRLNACLRNLATKRGSHPVPVYQLMGGSIHDEWARWPDQPWVLVGTQDQLLSRALNRGYAMNRFDWPIHFGLLNQDCHWVVDEIQLMGPGLWTTAQLDWMRNKRFASLKPCRTTWMSATVGTSFLATSDRVRDGIDSVTAFDPHLDQDKSEELRWRQGARRPLEWFNAAAGKRALPIHEQIALCAHGEHRAGTLTLVICNTIEMAGQVFRSIPDGPPRILLTSRFRRSDRLQAEQRLLEFEARRSTEARTKPQSGGRLPDDPGLVCVSTQVVEAGLDVSAHRLWSELAPWPSIIQRLGRMNRDGRDKDARARIWNSPPTKQRRRDGYIGPYLEGDLKSAATLIGGLLKPSSDMPFAEAMEELQKTQRKLLHDVLQPAPEPYPRALDVHGLFSTERHVHGGFTDVSAFVRGSDPDADLLVFWRLWSRAAPPRGDELDGPPPDLDKEGCPVAFHRLRGMLKARGQRAWTWNDDDDRWEACTPDELRPGMTVMLQRDTGGYDACFGWTGDARDLLQDVPHAGRGQVLQDDERSETGYWARLDVHLADARAEASKICDALGLRPDDDRLRSYHRAVVDGAALHDLGKLHPKWQRALPAGAVLAGGPWAKCPRVLAVDTKSADAAVVAAVARVRPRALVLETRQSWRGCVRLRWAVDQKLTRGELDELISVSGGVWAGHEPLRSGMRHEAASALAMWRRYREGRASYPALAVYLAAAHHGKVRTVLRATLPDANDVFGVEREPDSLELNGERWPLDFSVAADGAAGEWLDGRFVLTDHGWTGLVADLLGPWRSPEDDLCDVGAVPDCEPRCLGPFVLAWLEALVRVADWRASERPSQSLKPSEVPSGE